MSGRPRILAAFAALATLAGLLLCVNAPAAARGRSGRAKGPTSEQGAKVRVTMGPFMRDLTVDGVTVVFRTRPESRAAVLYRVAGEDDIRLEDDEPSLHHEFRLAPLERDKVYVYRVAVEGKEIPGGSFTTPPSPETPVIIGVYGDTRKYDKPHAEVTAGLARRSPDLVILNRDLVHDGHKESDWINFFRIEHELLRHTPFYPVIGNHDNRGKMGKLWFETLFGKGSPVRSIDYGPVHLVILSSEEGIRGQGRWLEEDLRKARLNPRITFVLAFIHHGPYGTGQFNGKPAVAKYIAPVLRKYGPSIVFSGHEHNYERGEVDGLPYYVSGGGGALLGRRYCRGGRCPEWSHIFESTYHYVMVEASPSELTICTYYPSGKLLEPCITRKARSGPGTAPAPRKGKGRAQAHEDSDEDPDEEQVPESDEVREHYSEGGEWTPPEPPADQIPKEEFPADAPRPPGEPAHRGLKDPRPETKATSDDIEAEGEEEGQENGSPFVPYR